MKAKTGLDSLLNQALSRGRELMGRPEREEEDHADDHYSNWKASSTIKDKVDQRDVELSPSRDKLIRANASQDMRDLNYHVKFDEREHESGLKNLIASKINRHVDRLKSQQNTLTLPEQDKQANMSFGGEEDLAQESQNPYDYKGDRSGNHGESRDEYRYQESAHDGYGDEGSHEDAYNYNQETAGDHDDYHAADYTRNDDQANTRYHEDGNTGHQRNIFGGSSENRGEARAGTVADHRVQVKDNSASLKDSVWPVPKDPLLLAPHSSKATREQREAHNDLEDITDHDDHDNHGAYHERDAYLGSRLNTQRLEVKEYVPLHQERHSRSITKSTRASKTISSQSVENLRKTTTLETREVPIVKPGDTIIEHLDESLLLNQYHDMKSREVHLTKANVKFALSRINPPRCLLDALEALFSLLYGLYDRIETHFFNISEKKYFLYKAYLQHSAKLLDVTSHLKYYIETQGIPARNVQKADECLVRYQTTIKRVEARDYKTSTDQIADFVRFHIQYYHVLRKLNLEPLSREMNNQVEPNRPFYLRNHKRVDWDEPISKTIATEKLFKEHELIDMMHNCVKRKTLIVIRGMNKPPESIFYAIKGLYTLLSNLIESPPFKLKFEWKFYQELLHSRIPDLIAELPRLLRTNEISLHNVLAAEAYYSDFSKCIRTKSELNDTFVLQYATKIMQLIHYASLLYRIYHPEN